MDTFSKTQGWQHQESSDPDRLPSVHYGQSFPSSPLPPFLPVTFIFLLNCDKNLSKLDLLYVKNCCWSTDGREGTGAILILRLLPSYCFFADYQMQGL